jgi:ATP-binding cassette, subfamily B, bacterial
VHRPSTVALADRVAFLDGGRIVATGTHSDLMDRIPAYRAILSQEAEPSRRTA